MVQYNAASPEAYLAALENDWHKVKLLWIRNLIRELVPDVVEAIEWKMWRYGDGERPFCHINVQKQYVSLYVGDSSVIEPSGELLTGLSCGKGCFRIKILVHSDTSRLPELLGRAVELWKQGVNLKR